LAELIGVVRVSRWLHRRFLAATGAGAVAEV
jgi:hypothetical protein